MTKAKIKIQVSWEHTAYFEMTPSRNLPKPTSMLGCQCLKGLVDFIFKNLKEHGGMVPAVDNARYEREVMKKIGKILFPKCFLILCSSLPRYYIHVHYRNVNRNL